MDTEYNVFYLQHLSKSLGCILRFLFLHQKSSRDFSRKWDISSVFNTPEEPYWTTFFDDNSHLEPEENRTAFCFYPLSSSCMCTVRLYTWNTNHRSSFSKICQWEAWLGSYSNEQWATAQKGGRFPVTESERPLEHETDRFSHCWNWLKEDQESVFRVHRDKVCTQWLFKRVCDHAITTYCNHFY